MLLPGATLGMLGGGQLGRMFTIAARNLGYKVVVLEPDTGSPAGQLADEHIIAAYDDAEALVKLGNQCDVITTEFENIPAEVLNKLTEYCPVFPSASAVEKAQDRIVEKEFILSCGLLPVPYGVINTNSDIADAVKDITFPAILKTARFGYDGKGQQTINSVDEVEAAFKETGQVSCVLEQRIDLDCEVSVILGRNEQGETQCFPVAENIHRDGILYQTLAPARVDDNIANAAQAAAQRMADKLDYVGVMAVEFFVTKKGELLVNEMAPRTHNSGHFTLDACVTSQFEQQVRMVCGLPFGDSRLLSPVVMTNMLGDLWGSGANTQPHWDKLLENPSTKLHLYGKKEARAGRKMGHYCTLADDLTSAQQQADKIFNQLPA
ncbi:5-(carboxyamino)imidazole ribonucleotide synthase [Cocleimonas sp. KMM 6892]|uniref:5-(carboxyamino)imidazole ribonucleotide synthase n=1 Tax=unclassified Cocleimonas TaxID=2639732 RepID=UPI002DB8A0AA|nr:MULTISPECIES: 5-(carboxyamino)imidazole ribonucleotide synthase [unclassified Cocleimonas]MEB8431303.1 5-(carboxyamino)imidazole ribonucleotide synthase [Cocleimonas sp. KMM 6892]MEC4713925.1 5-(carboxyamino)imidazole ribonucleotide synthase [Cocleimonas sp. KMM 6895]MEC4743256.1 5-(carboxyamino)imidazole ribonucleotide synthase [Cocleimonas sp. KMM 6896]